MTLSLTTIFTDHAVLQRDMPVPIWGKAAAHAIVTIRFRDHQAHATADARGVWKAVLPPLTVNATGDLDGEARSTLVVIAGAERIELHDVVVGEVWLCSGQSNMEWPLREANNAQGEIAAANYPLIRLLSVTRASSLHPLSECKTDGWKDCRPESASPFSAVGYFFGRKLHQELGVPIGLIHSSWGGTTAEAWMSRQGLEAHPTLQPMLQALDRVLVNPEEERLTYHRALATLEERTRDKQNKGLALGYAGVAELPAQSSAEWGDMELPAIWQRRGLEFSGILWFRKKVSVPRKWVGQELLLSIGSTDKSDITYFNGEQVGNVTMQMRPDSWSFVRSYPIPARLVKSPDNLIAVRVHSDKFDGGMRGPAAAMHLSCPAFPQDTPIPLANVWRYAVEENYGKVEPLVLPSVENPNTPTSLFNAMIAPLVGYALKGAIWYQGESNADRATQYRALFPALIQDWRQHWKRDDLAFHFVQLANFYEQRPEPVESNWADLRDAQASALRLPHTGMAVAIDVGEADDIHPRNKQAVGDRLARRVLHDTYAMKEIIPCGPRFVEAKRDVNQDTKLDGETVRLQFDLADGLHAKGDLHRCFAIAGDDRHFKWCPARIEGNSVILQPPRTDGDLIIRYGWADNPTCNLYNNEHLPAAPFEVRVEPELTKRE